MSKTSKRILGEGENMEEPEEKREVQIAREILGLTKAAGYNIDAARAGYLQKVSMLAQELISMHTLDTRRERPTDRG